MDYFCWRIYKGDFFLMNASRIDIDQFAKSMIAKKGGAKAVLLGKTGKAWKIWSFEN